MTGLRLAIAIIAHLAVAASGCDGAVALEEQAASCPLGGEDPEDPECEWPEPGPRWHR